MEPGSYRLTIASMGGDPVYEEYTNIQWPSHPIQIRLPRRASARPVGGVVSVNQLLQSKQNARATEINNSKAPHVRLWFWLRHAMKFVVG
jgi:uncharacterized membrane protein